MKINKINSISGVLVTTMLFAPCMADSGDHEKLPPWTSLTRAIRLEKFEEAKGLINAKTAMQPDLGGYHPLSYAAYTGNIELMEALLKAGADSNKVESNGKTALYITANVANLKGLELLHRYKAKATLEGARPPVVAAVHSGSVECLNKLFELYPEADAQSGWIRKGVSQDIQGDPVSYAAYQGYNDIAMILLAKKVMPIDKDNMGKTALHHAAINPNCSTALVKALIEVGCSPTQKANLPFIHYPYLSLAPKTPLDYAVVSGNPEKVKLLALASDPKISREEMRYAANIAASYNMDKTSQYLLGRIGEKLTSYREFLRVKANPEEQAVDATDMKGAELDRIMPRAKTRSGVMPGAGTVAIISDPELRNQAALLSVELSQKTGIELVERDQLNEVAIEQSLRGFEDGNTDALHKSLDLISARNAVVLSLQKIGDKSFIQASVINSASGLIVASHALPTDALTTKDGVRDMANVVSLSISQGGEIGTAVSMTPIAPQTLDLDAAMTTRNINTLLAHFVSNTDGLSALSRKQIQYLQREKAIGVEGSYWAAAWVIDGGISALKDGKTELTLRAIHAISNKEIRASGTVATGQIDEGLRKCWKDLVGKMQVGSPNGVNEASAAKDVLEKEAQILHKHAQWLYDAFYYEEAGRLMDACLAIGQHTKERVKLAIMIQAQMTFKISGGRYYQETPNIQQLSAIAPEYPNYGELGMYANMYHAEARAVNHEFRLALLDQSELYTRLGELAAVRLRMDIKPENAFKWANNTEYDRRMENTLDPFVTHALGELLFYVTAMDHSMIKSQPEDGVAFEAVSQQIQSLTQRYLDNLEKLQSSQNVNASDIKLRTLEYLLTRDYGYFSRHQPSLLKRMLDIASNTMNSQSDNVIFRIEPFFKLAASKSLSHMELGQAAISDSWKGVLIRTIEIGKQRGIVMQDTNPLYLSKDRLGKLKWLSFICGQAFSIQNNTPGRMVTANHPIGDLIGMDYRSQQMVTNEMAESCLLNDLDALKGTIEYLRASGCYRVVNHMREREDAELKDFLKNRTEITKDINGHRYAQVWSPEVWGRIKTVLSNSRKLSPDVVKLLDKLALSVREEEIDGEQIKLTNQGLIKVPGHQGRIFYSVPDRAGIHGGELWLPGTFYKPRVPLIDISDDNDFAIQVVSLSDRSVKTVMLPRKLNETGIGGVLIHQDSRRDYGRVLLTNEHAYYTPNGRVLFSIRRDNHEVAEVPLPEELKHPQLRLYGAHPEKGLILVRLEDSDNNINVRYALLVKGSEVMKVLASNRRKPEQSPMDKLNYNYTLDFVKDTAWVTCESTYNAHSFDLNTEQWTKIGKGEIPMVKYRRVLRGEYDYDLMYPDDSRAHFLQSPKGVYVGFWASGSTGTTYLTLPHADVFSEYMRGSIPVSVEPVDHPDFTSEWFPKLLFTGETNQNAGLLWSREPYVRDTKGWWISPNNAVKDGMYKAVLIGKEGENVIFGIKVINLEKEGKPNNSYYQSYGLSGIWMVPDTEFKAALKPMEERYSRLVNFESAWSESHMKDKAKIDFISAKNHFKWIPGKPIEMAGGGSVMGIKPKFEIKNMQLVMGIAPKDFGKKVDCRIEVGDRENPTVVFDSKNEGLKIAPNYHKSVVYVQIPDGVGEIRLINDSPGNVDLQLYDILFLDKE